jgi:hypothetical protein
VLLQLIIFLFWQSGNAQRIGNYVGNGSFEQSYNCASLNLLLVKYWSSIDSSCNPGRHLSICNTKVPTYGENYQYPKTGNAHAICTFFWPNSTFAQVVYPKNRLKSNLQPGHTYCVSFYVNICNPSTYGIDGFGAYFGDDNIDTIKYCHVPLTFLTPQVQNASGNVITDTLNWVAVTGTFTANGTEKFLLLGNFLDNNVVSTQSVNPTHLPMAFTDAYIDDVSCIEVDLPAYAGRDTTIFLGDSAYIGRERDFAIDTGCIWYRLPNTTSAIDTVSGMWVKPNAPGTYTYIVKQHLECSALKWDTVVITVKNNDVGIKEDIMNNRLIELYPNPADEILKMELSLLPDANLEDHVFDIMIYNKLGQMVKAEEITFKENGASIKTDNLPEGVYSLKLKGSGGLISKRFMIAR